MDEPQMRRQLFRQPSQNQDRLIRSHRLVLSQFGSGGFSVKNRPTFPVDFNFLDRIISVKEEKPSLIGSETPQKASDGDRFGIRFFTSRPNQAADASDSLPAIGRLAGFLISNLGLNSFPQCDQRADSGNCSQRVRLAACHRSAKRMGWTCFSPNSRRTTKRLLNAGSPHRTGAACVQGFRGSGEPEVRPFRPGGCPLGGAEVDLEIT